VTRSLRLLPFAALLLLSAACTTDPASTDAPGGAGGEPGSASTSHGGQSGSTESCPAGTNPFAAAKPLSLGLISGQLVDAQGEPTSAGLVQICGKDICINARVGDNGKLAEGVGKTLDTPACKFGDGLTWGKLAVPLEAGDSALGTLTTPRLPEFADAVPFTPGQAITSGGVTLTLAADARVEVDTLTYENEAERGFRAVALSGPALTQLGQDFVAGYALSPVETRVCPSPALSLENTTELPAGAGLELFLLGLDIGEKWAPYGAWQKVGEGQVSADGATLEFPDGLPLLTAIGVREKG
jgi:hypothetical protein